MIFAEILPGLLDGKAHKRKSWGPKAEIFLAAWGMEWVNLPGAGLTRDDYAATDWEEVGDSKD